MRALKRLSRGNRTRPALDEERAEEHGAEHDRPEAFAEPGETAADASAEAAEASDGIDDFDDGAYEIFRVHCPDCARPIALLADEDVLPEHALCPTPWNPFGLTVCAGSGRSVRDAAPAGGDGPADEPDVAALLTLPEGLDWRTQPFSHAGGPGSRPMSVPRMRTAGQR